MRSAYDSAFIFVAGSFIDRFQRICWVAIVKISPYAGHLPASEDLIDVRSLIQAYESLEPDPSVASHRVLFGTSGHRGSALDHSFNRNHILAICQAICIYRKTQNITGPLFLGFDTHALSLPAFETALEVLAANNVTVMISKKWEYTPTPVISHAILCYNKNRTESFADGIVITPSHNPPSEGGIKYNPPHGGPAEAGITNIIQKQANDFLENKLLGIRKLPFEQAIKVETTHQHDFLTPYVEDLDNVIDMDIIRNSNIKIGVDPLGGAGVNYWQPIADRYKLNLIVLNPNVDPQFSFMTRDWDGKIRMDPSSSFAMQSLIQRSKDFDISFGCDTDHDRHGIVTKTAGLMPSNDYLCASISYLFSHRSDWPAKLQVGKTSVSSAMIDRVARSLGRTVYEVPVGFKWFVEGLLTEQLGFAGEESAGATFLRKNGQTWTTDKDAFIPALLSAEMTARLEKDPAQIYSDLTSTLGSPHYRRIEAAASPHQRTKIKNATKSDIQSEQLGDEAIENILTTAPGNGESLGGIKIKAKNGWVAMRPSGTEDIYKIYGESFKSESHLDAILDDAQKIVNKLF